MTKIAALAALALALVVLPGCIPEPATPRLTAIISEEYEPETTWQPAVTTASAVRIRRGDFKLFPEENTRIAGTFFFFVDPRAPTREVDRKIAAAVAAKGGTHYLVTVQQTFERTERRRNHDAEGWRAIGQAFKDMGCKDDQGNTRLTRECWAAADTSPIYEEKTIREIGMAVVVIAVRPKEWEDLPEQLQPEPMRINRR